MKKEIWKNIKRPPKYGGEYQVVWNLMDGDHPVVTVMNYCAIEKIWTDPHVNSNKDITHELLLWTHLLKPPRIPKVIWKESIHELRNVVYGHCKHGENLANCHECMGQQ